MQRGEVSREKMYARGAIVFVAGFFFALLIILLSSNINQPCLVSAPSVNQFTSLQIGCNVEDQVTKYYDYELKGEVQDYLDNDSTQALANIVSVYYYNFHDKSWFGINEDQDFSPASLLKVPLLMAVLKQTETDPNILSEKITYKGKNTANDQYYKPEVFLETGKTYTVAQLAQIAITYSNNEAAITLFNYIGEDKLRTVYRDIGTTPMGKDQVVTVRQYMSVFKVLYNSYYLSRSLSEAALRLLSQTTFTKGLVAGVPMGTVVSHKFGERFTDDFRQLHDCGIIYAPKNPYLLCVMTRGNDSSKLAEIIKSISQIVYSHVSN